MMLQQHLAFPRLGLHWVSSPPARRAIAIRAIGRERIRRITISAPFQRRWAKDPNGCPFLGYCVFCVSRVKTLRLLVVWVAGDRSKVANNKSDLATAGRHQ